MNKSYIYILSNKNKSVLYIGVTSNLIQRIKEHKNSEASVFTKRYNVNELVYFEEFTEINEAIIREKQLKKWNREWKWDLIKEMNPNLIDLYDEIMLG